MKLIRVIEEFKNSDDSLNKEYQLNISAEKIVEILDDLILNQDDYPDEIYDPYLLNKSQIEKLIPHLKEKLKYDISKYEYYLSCYEDETV